jgi:hypothetical protein
MVKELEKTIDSIVKEELLSYFLRIVADWKHQPEFKVRKVITADGITIYVYPAGQYKDLWLWVSGGTRSHTIMPKTAGYPLAFRTDYRPRTRPGYKYRGPGESVGPYVKAKVVEHPGIKPRLFEKHIARFYRPKYRKHLEAALRRGAARL